MNSNLKNIATILILCTVAVGGYYFFIKKDATELDLSQTTGDLFVDVQKYIDRRELLSNVQLNTKLFNEQRFRSLVYFSTEGAPIEVGRTNPFDDLYETDTE